MLAVSILVDPAAASVDGGARDVGARTHAGEHVLRGGVVDGPSARLGPPRRRALIESGNDAPFGSVRAVAAERLYGEDPATLVATAGASAQGSFGPLVLRATAGCGTRPYRHALRVDCSATARTGARF